MPRISSDQRVHTAEFKALLNQTIANGEANDCSIKAVAIVCGVTYEQAKAALAAAGRKDRKGAYTHQIHAAVAALGKKVERANIQDIIAQYPKGHRDVLKNITTHHPARFNKVWSNGKSYLAYNGSHVTAIVDGTNHDWTVGCARRIYALYEVVG